MFLTPHCNITYLKWDWESQVHKVISNTTHNMGTDSTNQYMLQQQDRIEKNAQIKVEILPLMNAAKSASDSLGLNSGTAWPAPLNVAKVSPLYS